VPVVELESGVEQEQALGKESLALHVILALLILLFLGGIAAVAHILSTSDPKSGHAANKEASYVQMASIGSQNLQEVSTI